MGINFKQTFMTEQELMEVASLAFVSMAQNGMLDDITVAEHPTLFPTWEANWTGKSGTILMDNGELYRSIHDVINTAQNTKPSETPSMWTRIGDPNEEYPEWSQPIGAHDAYPEGAKVSHNGKKWINNHPNNVYEPGVYGWEEVV